MGSLVVSVLSDGEIRDLVHKTGLITPFREEALQGASYDMALGELMVIGGVPGKVARDNGGHELEPGSFVLVTTHERLRLPGDIIGHNGIMSPWARRGLVSLFSPQIDPGFEGVLEVPIFNAGDAGVRLLPGDQIFTVEFVRMSKQASYLWVERWGPKNPPSFPLPPKASRPNLIDVSELRNDQRESVVRMDGIEAKIANVQGSVSALEVEIRSYVHELRTNLNALERIVGGTTARRSLVATRWNLWVAMVAAALAVVAILLPIFLTAR